MESDTSKGRETRVSKILEGRNTKMLEQDWVVLWDKLQAEMMEQFNAAYHESLQGLQKVLTDLRKEPRTFWRVVNMSGQEQSFTLEFPAQRVDIWNQSTATVTVKGAGDITGATVGASLTGRWILAGNPNVIVSGTGTGQVWLRFYDHAAALLESPAAQVQLTGSLPSVARSEVVLSANTVTVTLDAGATYTSPGFSAVGFTRAFVYVDNVSGTSLDYSVATWFSAQSIAGFGNGATFSTYSGQPNDGTVVNITSQSGSYTGYMSPLAGAPNTWITVTNNSTTDSLTFKGLAVTMTG